MEPLRGFTQGNMYIVEPVVDGEEALGVTLSINPDKMQSVLIYGDCKYYDQLFLKPEDAVKLGTWLIALGMQMSGGD